MSNDILRDLWKNNATSIKDIDMEKLKAQSRSLNKQIVVRNSMEWIAAIFVAIVFSFFAAKADTTYKMIACIELVCAAIFVSFVLYRQGRNNKLNLSLTTKEHIGIYKNNLEKQISLLSKARYWYVAPIFLGLIMFHSEGLYSYLIMGEGNVLNSLYHIGVVIVLGAFIIYLNEVRAVRGLRKKLEALPDLDEN